MYSIFQTVFRWINSIMSVNWNGGDVSFSIWDIVFLEFLLLFVFFVVGRICIGAIKWFMEIGEE